jgi:hypothetical protein
MVGTEIVGRWIDNEDNVSSSPTITAIRPTARNKFLTPPRDDSIAAVASFSKNTDVIDKHVRCAPAG